MDPPEGCSPQITSIMVQCWAFDPISRPTFAEILLTIKKLALIN
jgi:hypothetical protein